MKRLLPIICILIFVFMLIFTANLSQTYAGRGCCSWHGGQSYCDRNIGKWVCNDGTYSPTCTCSSNEDELTDNSNFQYDSNSSILDFETIANSNNNYDAKNNKVTKYSEDNIVVSLIILILCFYLFNKIEFKPILISNKIIFNILNAISWIISIFMLWIVIPIYLGLCGHFILEIIFIFCFIFLENLVYSNS